jgi:hypothetical protein
MYPKQPDEKKKERKIVRGKSHIPENSVFYEKVVPALLIGLLIIMVILILVAAGVLLGIVPYN